MHCVRNINDLIEVEVKKARIEGELNVLEMMYEIPDAHPMYYAMLDERISKLKEPE